MIKQLVFGHLGTSGPAPTTSVATIRCLAFAGDNVLYFLPLAIQLFLLVLRTDRPARLASVGHLDSVLECRSAAQSKGGKYGRLPYSLGSATRLPSFRIQSVHSIDRREQEGNFRTQAYSQAHESRAEKVASRHHARRSRDTATKLNNTLCKCMYLVHTQATVGCKDKMRRDDQKTGDEG